MPDPKVAKRYSSALFNTAEETNQIEAVRDELNSLGALLNETDELKEFFQNPLYSTEQRSQIIKSLFENKLGALTYKFILFLEKKKRLDLIQDICSTFNDLYFEKEGIVKATIVSAIELSNEQIASIKDQLNKKLNKKIETDNHTDPTLLGGFKVIVGDHVLDCSLATQLNRIKHNIINA